MPELPADIDIADQRIGLAEHRGVVDRRDHRRGRAGACLLAVQVVGEAHLHLDPLADVVVGQGVGGDGHTGNLLLVGGAVRVHPEPLIGIGEAARQPVHVRNAACRRVQRIADPRRAVKRRRANRRRSRRLVVRRQAQVHRAGPVARPVEASAPLVLGRCAGGASAEVVAHVADVQPERGPVFRRQWFTQVKLEVPVSPGINCENFEVNHRTDGEPDIGQEGASDSVSVANNPFNSSPFKMDQRPHRHRPGPEIAPVTEVGRRTGGVGRHVDRHRVGVVAVDRAVVHLEGEGRIGVAARTGRGREGEVAVVDLGPGDDLARDRRRAVECQPARRRHGHDPHALEPVAGVRVVEAEIRRGEGVLPVQGRRHRVVVGGRGVVGGGLDRALDGDLERLI